MVAAPRDFQKNMAYDTKKYVRVRTSYDMHMIFLKNTLNTHINILHVRNHLFYVYTLVYHNTFKRNFKIIEA